MLVFWDATIFCNKFARCNLYSRIDMHTFAQWHWPDMQLTLGAAYLQRAYFTSRRSRFTGQSASWQSYDLSADGCHDRYGKQNLTYRHFAELHRVWSLVSAPSAASWCVDRAHNSSKRSEETSLCLFSRIVFEAGQNPQKEPLLFGDDFMISRSFWELKLQELKVWIVFGDEFGGGEEKQWYYTRI